ncbi:MAG: glycosyltransferase, partial [Reinekea sp.]|nr:glycosyltransferase [Reinekea sp.]
MKKRIAHFIETDVPGGAETMLLTLCERTRSDSVEPVVIHFNHPFFLEECSKRGLEQIVISNNKLFKKTALLPFFAIQFASILVKNRIDVVHSHLFGPIVGASLGAFIARKKHLGTLHDTYMIEEKPKRIKLLELASRLGTKLICVSQTMERFYRSEGSFQVNAITTIYNSVPKPTLSQNAQHVDPNQKDAPFIFFTSGRLVKLKRIQDLISAGAELKKQSTNFKILIAGSGPEENYLNQLVEDGHLEDVITFLGYRTDINELLSCSDVYVQCSETEGLSMSILEAMSLG